MNGMMAPFVDTLKTADYQGKRLGVRGSEPFFGGSDGLVCPFTQLQVLPQRGDGLRPLARQRP
jgi:hypothetical protein